MKTIKYFISFITFCTPFYVFSQQTGTSVSGGTLTINASINGGDYTQRDEVHIVPTTSDIHITALKDFFPGEPDPIYIDDYIYIDPSIILSAPTNVVENTTTSGGSTTPPTLNTSFPVGATSGSYAVSPDGSLNYSIPIVVPPGTAGMAPSLAISYNNNSRKSVLGTGWNLSGLSSISIAQSDMYHDGLVQAAQLFPPDGTPPFSVVTLDGNRLISNGYDDATSSQQYFSENEDFSLINYYSTGDYFVVQTKDGRTMEYGSTSDSKISVIASSSSNTITIKWCLSKVYDNYNNEIDYTYFNPNTSSSGLLEIALKQIDYTKNTNANIPAYNSVKFYYNTRQDASLSYLSVLPPNSGEANPQPTIPLTSTLILREIEVDCEGITMKKYDFTYGNNTNGDTYLNQIQETGSDESTLNPTIIEYGPSNPIYFSNPESNPTSPNPSIDPSNALGGNIGGIGGNTSDEAGQFISGDFNGDGLTDAIAFYYDDVNFYGHYSPGDQLNQYSVLLNNSTASKIDHFEASSFSGQTLSADVTPFSYNSYSASQGPNGIQPMDVNGDGIDDLILNTTNVTTGITTYNIYASTGTSFNALTTNISFPSGATTCFADIDGDKLPELVVYVLNENSEYFKVFSLSSTNSVKVTSDGTLNSYLSVVSFDYDGDGTNEFLTLGADFATLGASGENMYHVVKLTGWSNTSTSVTGSEIAQFNNLPVNQNDQFFTCDYNGDGITDFITPHINNVPARSGVIDDALISFGTGTGYTDYQVIPKALGYGDIYYKYLIADINGDGKSDLVFFDGTNGSSRNVAGGNINVYASFGGGTIVNGALQPNPMKLIATLSGFYLPPNLDYSHVCLTCSCPSPPCVDANYDGVINQDDNCVAAPVVGQAWTCDAVQPVLVSWLPTFNIGDYDGDGREDILFRAFGTSVSWVGGVGSSMSILHYDPSGKDNLISSITDGIGIETDFAFESISSANNYSGTSHSTNTLYNKGTGSGMSFPVIQFQKPLYAVSSVSSPDGIGGTSTTTYSYTDAEAEVQGKGFLGFGSVTATNPTNQVQTISTFSVISTPITPLTIIERVPLISSVYAVSSGISTPVSSKTFTASIIQPSSSSTTLQHFVGITQKSETNLLLNATTVTSYTYETQNSYTDNNIVTYTVNVNSGLETYTVNNVYQTIAKFAGGIPCRRCTTGTIATRGNVSTYKGSINTYNDQGQVTQTKQNPAYFFPTAPPKDKEVDITYNYDSNTGVLTSYGVTAPNDDASPQQKTYSYLYDSYMRFKTTSTNPLQNQSIQTTYSSLWGTPLTITGYDGLTTKYTYDAYGRELSCATPDNLTATFSYDWVAQGEVAGDPSQISIPVIPCKVTATKKGTPTTVKYYDILGRSVRTKTDGFQNPFYTFTAFDGQGHIALTTSPYETIGGTSGYKPVFSTYTYDQLGQINTITRTDNVSPNSYITSYKYDYNTSTNIETKTVTPPDGNSYKEMTDASKLKITTIDNNGTTLNYIYDANHHPIQVNMGSSTTLTTLVYDAYGRQQSITEPNSGMTKYEYNAYGLLYTQTDQIGNQYTYTYDPLDRITIKANTSGTDNYTYTYLGTGNGINQIGTRTGPTAAVSTNFVYDPLNRVTQITESTNGGLSTNYTYDEYNNISTIIYPGNFAVNHLYTSAGYLNTVNRSDGTSIWQANTVSPMGQYTQYTLGNGVSTVKAYDNFGFPVSYLAKKGATTIQDLRFTFDQKTGSLSSRKDEYDPNNVLSESFTYDNLNRLWTITNTAGSVMTMQYATNGNIMVKPDVGSYTYNTPQQNQVLTVSNPNGSISLNTQNISYGPFKKPENITEIDINTGSPIDQLNFVYGPEQQRREADLIDANGNQTNTYYSLNYDKQIMVSNNAATEVNYITGGDGLCAVFVKTPADNGKLYYVYTDHLGSILTLTDDQGVEYTRQSFDAWGQPRDPKTWVQYNAANPNTNNVPPGWLIRGYTGHEDLPEFDLVNMNGRLYEPLTGRMKSVDDHLGNDGNSQAFNRYSYCNNNPLSSIDPTGEDGLLLAFGFIAGGLANVSENYDNIMHAHSSIEAGLEYFAVGGIATDVGILTGNPFIGAGVGAGLTIGVDALGGIGPGGPGRANVLNHHSTGEEWLQAGIAGATSALEGEGVADDFVENAYEGVSKSDLGLGSDSWKTFSEYFNGGDFKKIIGKSAFGVLQDYGKNSFNIADFSVAKLAKSIVSNELKASLDKYIPDVDNPHLDVNPYSIPGFALKNFGRTFLINGVANYFGNVEGGLFKAKTYSNFQNFTNDFVLPIPSIFGFNGDPNYSFSTDDQIDASIDAVHFLFYLFK
jgi:RHS repeat-associated protein